MEVRDDVYCLEIARRSVARAALHLGIDAMSQEALDVLGDTLLEHLKQMGSTLAHLVEASGRSSSHCNTLDAIQAMDQTTASCIHGLHFVDAAATNSTPRTGWQGLAAFLYGPNYRQVLMNTQTTPQRTAGAGGKVGPSSTTNGEQTPSGWEAPYFDEVVPFPTIVATADCSNPHNLPSSVGLSLHFNNTEDAAKPNADTKTANDDTPPDDLFFYSEPVAVWGVLDAKTTDEEKKRKPADETKEDDKPPAKKPKSHDFIPTFYPTPPASGALARTIVVDDDKESQKETLPVTHQEPATVQEAHGVRSSLVEMGQYWGTWNDRPKQEETAKMAVPMGRTAAAPANEAAIVPLGRASQSRVSKILEGSMDDPAMG